MLDVGSTCPRDDFEFRISNFEFAARHSPDTVGLTVLATRTASSTVNEPQSASKAIYHSLPSESRGGQSPTWLSEGGWAGGEGISANLRNQDRGTIIL